MLGFGHASHHGHAHRPGGDQGPGRPHHGCSPRGGGYRFVFGGPGGFFGRDFGGRGFGGDGPGGFSRRRGLYNSEELRLVLLALIAEQPRHGYDLIREIERRSGGAYAPSSGVVYPNLTMLVDMGQIAEQDTAGTRKVYAATAEGVAHLASHRAKADALLARSAELNAAARGDAAPVKRALRNLHGAVMDRLARPGDDELVHRVAALLDEVTQKIERS